MASASLIAAFTILSFTGAPTGQDMAMPSEAGSNSKSYGYELSWRLAGLFATPAFVVESEGQNQPSAFGEKHGALSYGLEYLHLAPGLKFENGVASLFGSMRWTSNSCDPLNWPLYASQYRAVVDKCESFEQRYGSYLRLFDVEADAPLYYGFGLAWYRRTGIAYADATILGVELDTFDRVNFRDEISRVEEGFSPFFILGKAFSLSDQLLVGTEIQIGGDYSYLAQRLEESCSFTYCPHLDDSLRLTGELGVRLTYRFR